MNFDFFLDTLSPNQRTLVEFLHQIIMGYPQVSCRMRFNIPFYDRHTWFSYINPKKKVDGVELCFIHGNKMDDALGILEFRDRKQVGGVLITKLNEINEENIFILIDDALTFDEKTTRKK